MSRFEAILDRFGPVFTEMAITLELKMQLTCDFHPMRPSNSMYSLDEIRPPNRKKNEKPFLGPNFVLEMEESEKSKPVRQ